MNLNMNMKEQSRMTTEELSEILEKCTLNKSSLDLLFKLNNSFANDKKESKKRKLS